MRQIDQNKLQKIDEQVAALDDEITKSLGDPAKLVTILKKNVDAALGRDLKTIESLLKDAIKIESEFQKKYFQDKKDELKVLYFHAGVDLQVALDKAEKAVDRLTPVWEGRNVPDELRNLQNSIKKIRAIDTPKSPHVDGSDIALTGVKSAVAVEDQKEAELKLKAGSRISAIPGRRLRAWSPDRSRTSDSATRGTSVTKSFETVQAQETQKAQGAQEEEVAEPIMNETYELLRLAIQAQETQKAQGAQEEEAAEPYVNETYELLRLAVQAQEAQRAQGAHEAEVAEKFVKEIGASCLVAIAVMEYAKDGIQRNSYFKKRAFELIRKMDAELQEANPQKLMGKRPLIEREMAKLNLVIPLLEQGDQTPASPSSVESTSIQRADSNEDPAKGSGHLQVVQKALEGLSVAGFAEKTESILEYVSLVLEDAPNDIGDNNAVKANAWGEIEELKKALETSKTLDSKEEECARIGTSLDYLLMEILKLENGDQASASGSSVNRAPLQHAELGEESVEGSEQIQAEQKARDASRAAELAAAAGVKRQVAESLDHISKEIEEKTDDIGNNKNIKADVDKKIDELKASMRGMQSDAPMKNYGGIEKKLLELDSLLGTIKVAGKEPASDLKSESASKSSVESTSQPSVEPTSEPSAEPTSKPSVASTSQPSVGPTSEPSVEPTSQQGPESFEDKVKRHEEQLQQQKLDAYEKEFQTAEEGMWLNHLRTQLQMLVEFCKEMNRIAAQAI